MGKKTVKYAVNGGLIFGITNALLNVIEQINDENVSSINWSKVLKAGGKGALLGAGGGAAIGAIMDSHNQNKELINTSAILATMFADMNLDKESTVYSQLTKKADSLIHLIKDRLESKLGAEIVKIGSSEDGSALQENFDIDIAIPFAKNSFSSTQVMIEFLYEFIEDSYNDDDLIEVRMQKKSVGLLFNLDDDEYKIDLVPLKLSQTNSKEMVGYLAVNNTSFFGKNSYTKTNISSLKEIKLTPTQNKLLVILKNWKNKESIPISSHLLKLLILDAYKANKGKIPRDFTKKLLMIIYHISENIMFRRITSVENTNNVLTDMDLTDKRKIKKACDKLIDEYEYHPNSIVEYI